MIPRCYRCNRFPAQTLGSLFSYHDLLICSACALDLVDTALARIADERTVYQRALERTYPDRFPLEKTS